MAKRLLSILCEGPHDVAFLVRVLKYAGFQSTDDTKIGDFPAPMNALLKTAAQKADVESLNLSEAQTVALPKYTLQKDGNHLFLYALGGDSKKNIRCNMLNDFLALIPSEPGELSGLPRDTELGILYFFDADNKGINQRLIDLNKELGKFINDDSLFSQNAQIKKAGPIQLGCFIFTNPGSDQGKLEDIMLPLMRQGKENDDIFEDAKSYLERHGDPERRRKLKVGIENGKIIEKRSESKHKYDESKSLIGIAGQLQKSGASNVVAIHDLDYLTLSKVENDPVCQTILHFFKQACLPEIENKK